MEFCCQLRLLQFDYSVAANLVSWFKVVIVSSSFVIFDLLSMVYGLMTWELVKGPVFVTGWYDI